MDRDRFCSSIRVSWTNSGRPSSLIVWLKKDTRLLSCTMSCQWTAKIRPGDFKNWNRSAKNMLLVINEREVVGLSLAKFGFERFLILSLYFCWPTSYSRGRIYKYVMYNIYQLSTFTLRSTACTIVLILIFFLFASLLSKKWSKVWSVN